MAFLQKLRPFLVICVTSLDRYFAVEIHGKINVPSGVPSSSCHNQHRVSWPPPLLLSASLRRQHALFLRITPRLIPARTNEMIVGHRHSQTSHVTHHTSHVTRHKSHVTRHTSHFSRHTSHITRHKSHVTFLTSHVTRHTSHVTRHKSQVTRQTSQVTIHT